LSERAYNEFKLSFELQKRDIDVARELMIECLRLGRGEEGINIGNHALSLDKGNSGLIANLALAYLIAGNIGKSKRLINKALEFDDKDQINLNLRTLILDVESGVKKQPKKYDDLFD